MESNFDGLVGPTHNYSGLSFGNIASQDNRLRISRPKAAALQGLQKMKALADQGFSQALLPPQERPAIWMLRRLGFEGSDLEVLAAASRCPQRLALHCSASSMWCANAATVSPSVDTADGRLHITPANLASYHHRAIETETTERVLRRLFYDEEHFVVHSPLPASRSCSDEGAANHSRLCRSHLEKGLELFVYGRKGEARGTCRYLARQTLLASESIARLHQLDPEAVIFAQQHPDAIDAGCFHNDVISVCNERVILYHEAAFIDTPQIIDELNRRCVGGWLCPILIPNSSLSLDEAVASYLFNSQLLTRPDGTMLLVAPEQCREQERSKACLEQIVSDTGNPITDVFYLDLKQSMRNGGGPACLRLRIVLSEEQKRAVRGRIFLDEELYNELWSWINRHYRETLSPADLADPLLLEESRTALDELTAILEIGSIYPFQQERSE